MAPKKNHRPLRPALLHAALLASLAPLSSACELTSTSCPGKLSSVGTLTLSYSPRDGGDTCLITRQSDGGPANLPLGITPSTTSLALCAGQDGAGAVSLALAIGSSGYRTVTADAGSFALTASTANAAGSACACPIDLTETLSATLLRADGGTVGFESDGGFAPLSGLVGALDYAVRASAGGAACSCNLPCGIHYSLAGTP